MSDNEAENEERIREALEETPDGFERVASGERELTDEEVFGSTTDDLGASPEVGLDG